MKHILYCGSRSLKVKSDQYLLTQQIDLTGSNPIEALIFFRLFPSNCLNWKIYWDNNVTDFSTTAIIK